MKLERVQEVLGELGCEKIRPYKEGTKVGACCPLALYTHPSGIDRHPSFKVSVNPEGMSFSDCYACGHESSLVRLVERVNQYKGGTLTELLAKVRKEEDLDLGTLLDGMKWMYDWQDPKRGQKLEAIKQKALYPVHDEAALQEYVGKVPRYLLDSRKLTLDVCRQFKLGWDPKEKRAVFPVWDDKGKLVGMQGRGVEEGIDPKWRNYWNFPKSKFVYGLHAIQPGQPIIVMEGVIDALVWVGYGIPNCVSVFGSKPTQTQMDLIRRKGLPVYMAYDGDEAGDSATRDTTEHLNGRVPLFQLAIPRGMDPDDLTKGQALDVIERKKLVL